MAARIQLAGQIPAPSMRSTILGLLANGDQPGTLTLHADGSPVPIYASETAPTADASGTFVTDSFGMPPGWIDISYVGQQLDYHVPPASPVTVTLGAPLTSVAFLTGNPADDVDAIAAGTGIKLAPSGVTVASTGASVQGQVPAFNALKGQYQADDGVHSPWVARAISVTNLFTDPRATTPGNFAASAPALGAPLFPASALSTATSGGTVPAGVYQVQTTYVTAAGETVPGPTWSVTTTGATSTIKIASPPAVNGVTGWYAYVSQAGGSSLTRQQAPGSPTAIGTALTLTVAPTNTGAAPPGSNTTAAGSVSQTPTSRADGFQQLASPKACQEIVATPTSGGYVALASTIQAGALRFAQLCAARMAGRVLSVAGGGSWHLALAAVYYNASAVKQGEQVVWSSPTQTGADSSALSAAMGGSGGWVIAEGFDNQTPTTSTTYYELELRVYNDSGTPGAVTLRGTEIVQTVDPSGDIPYYVGGDLGAALQWAPYFGSWLGTADASQSIGIFDPAGIYPNPSQFGFNNYGVVFGYESPANSVKLIRELGCTVSRENATLSGGQASGPYIAPTLDAGRLANLRAVIASGVKVILQTGPPSWMQPAGYGWPTDAPTQAQFAAAVVAMIDQLGAENVYGVQPYNEPNTRDSGGTTGGGSPSTYSAYLSAIYTAVHAAHPSVKVFGGTLAAGLLSMNAPGMPADQFLAGMYLAGAQYDVLDLHPYPPNGFIGVTGNNGTVTYYNATSAPSAAGYGVNFNMDQGFDATLAQIKNRMAANGDTRPIFISETGQLSVSEHQQAQVESLLLGRLKRDPQVLGVCFNAIVDTMSRQAIPADWGPVDPKTHRRREAARALARMRAMPPPVWHDSEVLRLDPSAAGGAPGSAGAGLAGTPGAVAALAGGANQVTVGVAGQPMIALGGMGPADTSVLMFRLPSSSGLTIQQGQVDNSHPTLTIKALAGQTNNQLSIQNSSGTANFAVAADGSTISSTVMLAQGASTTPTGSGALMETLAGVGYHTAYNFTGAAYMPVALLGTTTLVRANAGSVTITGVAGSPTAIVQGAASQTADLLQVQNSSGSVLLNVDSTGKITQYEYAFSTWKTLPHLSVVGQYAGGTSGQFLFYYGGLLALASANTGLGVFYLDPADYGAGSRTVNLRIRATCLPNAVAPGRSYTVGLYPVATTGGASGAGATIATLGAAVATATIASPAAGAPATPAVSSPVAFPAAGHYCFAVTPSGATAAGAIATLTAVIQIQQV